MGFLLWLELKAQCHCVISDCFFVTLKYIIIIIINSKLYYITKQLTARQCLPTILLPVYYMSSLPAEKETMALTNKGNSLQIKKQIMRNKRTTLDQNFLGCKYENTGQYARNGRLLKCERYLLFNCICAILCSIASSCAIPPAGEPLPFHTLYIACCQNARLGSILSIDIHKDSSLAPNARGLRRTRLPTRRREVLLSSKRVSNSLMAAVKSTFSTWCVDED